VDIPSSVDVVMLTKNSDHILTQCLESVYKNIPVNELIIVDGGSNDKTLEIIESFAENFGKVKVISSSGTRGEARQIGIQNVKTEWFVFVDSDVVLCRGWFKKIVKHIDNSTGAVWGVDVPANVKKRFLRNVFIHMAMHSFRVRGGTHDLLLRYECVKDIEIPNSLHVYEDAFIKEWILKKGYKVKALTDPYCLHYRPSQDWSLHGGIMLASSELRYGFRKYHTMFYVYSACYWLLQNMLARRAKYSR